MFAVKHSVYILWNNRQPSKGLLYLNEKNKTIYLTLVSGSALKNLSCLVSRG